ncbi:MAG TPA: M14 family metallopeptidase, partial [Candidatus Eisenbacteria bacterium]|nr:M14 family metallopeptidase [Candidatus Eisenbacteria bacterium]
TPEGLRAGGKPILFAQAGIHAGEIDGKDAGMMFLRDLTVKGRKKDLLSRASFLFLPIFNVDGHERFSRYGRINQRGPVESGWRTTSANLNLNRDYAKLDAPEMRCLVEALNTWTPDLYLDLHVTDGLDHQYDVTWSYNGPQGWSPNQAAWMDAILSPALTRDLYGMGHTPGPYVEFLKGNDPESGVRFGMASPRYSNGYGDARHMASILVETHSLKSYRQRVLGTYVFLESTMRTLGGQGKSLRQAAQADRRLRNSPLVLDWKDGPKDEVPMEFLAVRYRWVPSDISGGRRQEWLGEPVTLRVPRVVQSEPEASVTRPSAYWIPPVWTDVIDRLARHGIQFDRIKEGREVAVTMYRIENAKLASSPFEGRVMVSGKAVPAQRAQWFSPGSVRVPTDQPLGDLAMLLLEPQSEDSFFQWGFFHSILQKAEYAEAYVMEPLAAEMMTRDPELAAAFQTELQDTAFAHNPRARLDWFYRRSPYADERWNVYPVAREE